MQFQITTITIENFRSIKKQTIELGDISVFVGNNDEGKSNVLRALDLFFNNQTLTPTQFDRDFCYFATVPEKKAKEIRITLNCHVPKSYAADRDIRWHKVWRRTGPSPHLEERGLTNGETFGSRSRIPALLAAVRYHYVPAIKGKEYFSKLLGDIHDVLTEAVENDIRSASANFTTTINNQTNQILLEIRDKLKITSTLQLPADLRDLFSRLDFQSSVKEHQISLEQRGDGIKVRHIPIMLDFLAKQVNKNRVHGSIPIFTIWGYEEPENNLEMAKAVELAGDFRNYSEDMQILLTTPSPAFYSLATQAVRAKLYLVKKDSEQKSTELKLCETGSLCELDEHMGLLPYIVPSFQKAVEERTRLQKIIEEIRSSDKPTLFLEGKTDKKIIMRAIALFEPQLKDKIAVDTDDSAGANWVKDKLIAWQHSRKQDKAIGIFDKDKAGYSAKLEFIEKTNSCTNKIAKAITFDTPKHLHKIFEKEIKMPVCIEEMFPLTCWQHASEQGWLEHRTDVFQFNEFIFLDKTFIEFCKEKGLTEDELLYVQNRIKKDCKKDFANYVCNLSDTNAGKVFESLKKLIGLIKTTLLGEEQIPVVCSEGTPSVENNTGTGKIDNPSEETKVITENKPSSTEAAGQNPVPPNTPNI